MLTTNELLDKVKYKKEIQSDYALARYLKVTPSSISLHRCRPHGADYFLALRIAEALDLHPEYVLVCTLIERAKCSEEKAAYQRLGAWLEMSYKSIPRAFPRP